VIAAIVPAILYYLAVFLSVHFMACREELKPTEEDMIDVPSVATILRRDWVFLPPIGLIVWGVISLDRPAFAGAIACLALLPAALRGERHPSRILSSIYSGLAGASLRIVGVGVACAVAGLVVGTLAMTDLTGKISSGLFSLASGNMALTVVTAVGVIIVLGMGMPTPAVYALAAVLAAPALTSLGVETLPAHLFIVYFASMSAITPPVAVAAFAAASIAQDNPLKIATVACRVAFVAFVLPVIFIINPGVMLIGDALTVAIAVTSSVCAVVMLAAAFEGFLVERLSGMARVAAGVIGVMLISPWNWVSLAGGVMFLAFVAVLLMSRRREIAGRRAA
jgi:TRAP transporter 4TM/12TM fusion protein